MMLLPSLKRALHSMEFSKPSAIQEKTLSTVLSSVSAATEVRDIVGVAETGSGKTLAYSLPILQEILLSADEQSSSERPLSALILCPTRELALQVRQHIGDVAYRASIPLGESFSKDVKHMPRVNIITICGGMSIQKQKRLLSVKYGVDIVVATPGRLWDMIQEDEKFGKSIKQIKYLVLDEADRMIENGHFAELENIVALTRRKGGKTGKNTDELGEESNGFVNDFDNAHDSLEAWPVREDMRTYVFSATMSKDLQRNVKNKGKKRVSREDELGTLGALGTSTTQKL